MTPQDMVIVSSMITKAVVDGCKSGGGSWTPFIQGMGGAVIGAMGAFLSTYRMERHKRNVEAKQITAALVAEIAALVEISHTRGYLAYLQDIVTALESAEPGSTVPLTIPIPEHYSRIYQGVASKIGQVDPRLVREIVRFHQLVDAVVQDVKSGGLFNNGVNRGAFAQTTKIFADAMRLGEEIVQRAGRCR
jgi:hypothetical protein